MEQFIITKAGLDLELHFGDNYLAPVPPEGSIVKAGVYAGFINFFFFKENKAFVSSAGNGKPEKKKKRKKSWQFFDISQPTAEREIFVSFPFYYFKEHGSMGRRTREHCYGKVAETRKRIPAGGAKAANAAGGGNGQCGCGQPKILVPVGTGAGTELVAVYSDLYCSTRSGL